MSHWILCIGSLLVTFTSWSQPKDTVRTFVLSDVVVYEDLLKTAEIGLSEIVIDSLTLAQSVGTNISDLLRNTAAGQIRSYGTNGLTSPSFRGTGASHTAILWNGINLQSSLSGGLDLSLLPVGFVNEVTLQKGGTSSMYGSGAIGGTIQLNNQTKFGQGLELGTQQKAGSFGNYYESYEVGFSGDKFTSSTLFFHRKLDNDYPYQDQYGNLPKTRVRVNAASNQWGVLQQNDWQINDQHLIGFKLWYQDNAIEIPNSIIASDNTSTLAVQNDAFVRAMLNWNYDRDHLSLVYKQALIWHELDYQPAVGEPSNSTLTTWINRLELNYDMSEHHSLIAGINQNFDLAKVDAFGSDDPTRNSTALFASFKSSWIRDKLLTALSFREELIDGELVPFSPSLGVEYSLFPRFWLQGNVSRNYRLPTFNDLYWMGDGAQGNVDLIAETSLNYEAGMKYDIFKPGFPFELSAGATLYHYLVDDWIQWREESGIWSPMNLKKVQSSGLETQISGQFKADPLLISLDLIYNYTSTINKELSEGLSDRELDKQLTYTPLNEASFNLKLGYKTWRLTLNHAYTGKQYTEGENRDRFALDAYRVTNIYLNQNFEWRKLNLGIQGEINNLLDVNYENRRGYPMYGRNYSLGLTIKFKNKT